MTSSGAPVNGATLEIVNLDPGVSAGAQGFGLAATMSCVSPGHYRVTAHMGTIEATEEVLVGEAGATVVLRLPSEVNTPVPPGSAVSVADLKVPDKARRALEKAQEKLRKHDLEEASRRVDEALKIDSNYSAAYQLRGLLNLTQQHVADAITDLEHAVKLDSGNAVAHIILGAAYNSSKQYKDAAHSLEAALPLAANAWQLHYELGKAYAGMGRPRESLASLNRALELNPNFPAIRLVRAFVLLHTGQYHDAAADLTQYLHQWPNGPDAVRAKQLLAGIPK